MPAIRLHPASWRSLNSAFSSPFAYTLLWNKRNSKGICESSWKSAKYFDIWKTRMRCEMTLALHRYPRSPLSSSNPSLSGDPNKPCLGQCSLGNPEMLGWVGGQKQHMYESFDHLCKHDRPRPGHKLGSADSSAEIYLGSQLSTNSSQYSTNFSQFFLPQHCVEAVGQSSVCFPAHLVWHQKSYI